MPSINLFLSVPCLGSTLTVHAQSAGEDLCVLILGGSRPHIGSVSVGIPRQSLHNTGTPSATVSTINILGHKDDSVGNLFAHAIAAQLGVTVSASCGIHFDNASKEDLATIVHCARALLDQLLSTL